MNPHFRQPAWNIPLPEKKSQYGRVPKKSGNDRNSLSMKRHYLSFYKKKFV